MSFVTIREGEVEKWDPFAHPRDENGRFLKLPNNVYKFGKSKTATYKTLGVDSITFSINLDPGDVLWKTKIGNFYLHKADGSYVWYGNGSKPPRAMTTLQVPPGSVKVEEAKAITVKARTLQEAATQVDEAIGKEPTAPPPTQRQQEVLRARSAF